MRSESISGEADVLFTGGPVVSMDEDRNVFEAGFVAIRDGLIAGYGSVDECTWVATETVDSTELLVMPGLINCHTHLFQGIHRGLFDEMPLSEWLVHGLWPLLRTTNEQLAYDGARLAISELLLSGVTATAAGEFGAPEARNLDGVLRALTESGMRAVVSRMAIDGDDERNQAQFIPADLRDSIDGAIDELDRLRSTWGTDLVQVVPEALGVLRCTPDMVRTLHEYATSNDTSMFMHFASSEAEVATCREIYGRSCVEQLDALGALDDRMLLAHVIWVSETDISLLARSGARVSHNPVSNLYYAVGIAPLMRQIEAGIPVGLGVDGAATNCGQNLWETMKFSMLLQKYAYEDATKGSAELALELATLGGAKALGLGHQVGSIEVGKQADVITISRDSMSLTPMTGVSSLVYAPDPGSVRDVMISGKFVVRSGQLKCWPHDEVIAQARESALVCADVTGLKSRNDSRSTWRWHRAGAHNV